jgi:hypothetical protein
MFPLAIAACFCGGDMWQAACPYAARARSGTIFDIEREISGLTAEERHIVRRGRIVPLVAGLEDRMRAERARLSRHAEAAKAMDYILKRWASFTRFLDDGRICLTMPPNANCAALRSGASHGCSAVLTAAASGQR